MQHQPEHGEGGEVFVVEDLAEVELQVGWPGERRVVAQEAKLESIGAETPQRSAPIRSANPEGSGSGTAAAIRTQVGAGRVERLRRQDNKQY